MKINKVTEQHVHYRMVSWNGFILLKVFKYHQKFRKFKRFDALLSRKGIEDLPSSLENIVGVQLCRISVTS